MFVLRGRVRANADQPVQHSVTWDAAFPGGNSLNVFAPPATASIRADVSDPFGSFDITAVRLDVMDALGAAVLTLNGSGAAGFELRYRLRID